MSETTVSYQCPNCGAPLRFHPGDARIVCAHCHTELDAAALEEHYRAQEEAAAKTAEEKEAAANAPNAQWSEEIQSMYVPFWLFDADVSARATFRAETDNVTETSDETITETRIYSCHRSGTMSFHAVPADGSRRMDDNYMESIEPFDFSALIPFSPAYLAGHLAEQI